MGGRDLTFINLVRRRSLAVVSSTDSISPVCDDVGSGKRRRLCGHRRTTKRLVGKRRRHSATNTIVVVVGDGGGGVHGRRPRRQRPANLYSYHFGLDNDRVVTEMNDLCGGGVGTGGGLGVSAG